MKFLLNEMIPGRVSEQLRSTRCDCIAISDDPALRGLEDPDLFAFAQAEGRATVTYDRDYLELHRQYVQAGQDHAGLVIVHPGRFPPQQTARLVTALRHFLDTFQPQPSFVAWLQAPPRISSGQ